MADTTTRLPFSPLSTGWPLQCTKCPENTTAFTSERALAQHDRDVHGGQHG